VGRDAVGSLEALGKIRVAGIGEKGGDLRDAVIGVFQKIFGVLHLCGTPFYKD